MEIQKEINFLQNPHINASKLNYEEIKVYANMFEIKLTKDIKMYQYSYKVTPEIAEGDIIIRKKLFRESYRQIKAKYGYFFISGNLFYSMNKVEEIFNFKTSIRLNSGKIEYIIELEKFKNERILKKEDINKDPLSKQFIELIIKDILLANKNIEQFGDIYLIKDEDEDKDKKNKNSSFDFYLGYKISLIETDKGNFLNVSLKNKIIRRDNLLEYFKTFGDINKKSVREDICAKLKGRSFKVRYSKRNYRIDDILFDRNPKTQKFQRDNNNITLIKYYKEAYGEEIQDENQPLILVSKKDSQEDPINLYFVPEFCHLVGIDEDEVKSKDNLPNINLYPKERVDKTNKFVQLLKDETEQEDKKTKEIWSSKKKSDFYGITVEPLGEIFQAYYMDETHIVDGNNKIFDNKSKNIKMIDNFDMINWLLFYDENDRDNAEFLYNKLKASSGKYNIKIEEPKWVIIPKDANFKRWIDEANIYFGKDVERKYDFILFLLGNNSNILYPKLKVHSLCTNGYISQVVKVDTLYKKGIKSICSKILLQINAKQSGALYKIKLDESLSERRIMIVGVDSSKHRDKNNYGTGIAMVASINNSFTDFYNKVQIIKKDNINEEFHFCISQFIEEAVEVYKNYNKGNKPDWIIIYRQGVSLEQKEFLKREIREIDNTCNTKNILYYYILVNTKSNLKFFQYENKNCYNPYSGLLVLDDRVINRNFFEFYIQPQEVTEGSATPTCFHVAYGNLNFTEIIPKFTFDLCHLYSNWQGSVRIPNVIKCAEKLSKMTAKYKLDELNKNIEIGQAYL